MPITNISIRNCKSIKNANISLNNINCLIGENGTGKSNIIKAIQYFYSNLTANKIDKDIHDSNNPYTQALEITITYDFNNLLLVAEKRLVEEQVLNVRENPIFKRIHNYIDTYGKENGLISLTLRQFRNNVQTWIPNDYSLRTFIRNTFPIYVTDTRHINLTDWEVIWQVIGDLGKIKPSGSESDSDEKLEDFLKESYGDKSYKIMRNTRIAGHR